MSRFLVIKFLGRLSTKTYIYLTCVSILKYWEFKLIYCSHASRLPYTHLLSYSSIFNYLHIFMIYFQVNLNNIQNVPMETFEELAAAMEANTNVTSLNLANTNLQDRSARTLAKMLAKNRTLQKLNVESNFITGDFYF